MQFPTYSSPHTYAPRNVSQIMHQVLLALLPGIVCSVWFFGWGTLFNILIAAVTCIGAEAVILRLRKRPIQATLADGSALLTGVLLALCLPALTPWWVPFIGALFAIVVAKQLYGGLGFNPFNPAMIGYVVLLISFPLEMTLWSAPPGLGSERLSFLQTAHWVFAGDLPPGTVLDAFSMATPLDTVKTRLHLGFTVSEIQSAAQFGSVAGIGWEWVNFWFLAGGLYLLVRGIVPWQIPVAMLGALFIIATFFYGFDSDQFASPVFHLFSGAAMLGAFFIATDPVTASTTYKGRLIFGAGIGLIAWVIRTWGGYPDGVAFAVLLMNMAVPTLDYYTRPRVFGGQAPEDEE